MAVVPKTVTVVIPTWNSSSYLDQTLRTVVTELAEIETLQIVVIDDSSRDNTFDVAEETLRGLPRVSYVIIQLAKNLGQSAATAIGLSHAAGDVVVTLDDDLSFSPDQIFRLFDSLSASVDFVVGAPHRYHNSATRRFFSEVARRLAIRAFKIPKDFVLSSFFAYQRKFLSRLDFPNMQVDEIGWMFQYTSRYLNSTITSSPSIREKTKYDIKKLARTARPLIVPVLKVISTISRWCSAILALFAALLLVTYLFRALAVGNLLPGFPTVVILLLLNLSGTSILLALQLSSVAAIHNLRRPNLFLMQRRVVTRM